MEWICWVVDCAVTMLSRAEGSSYGVDLLDGRLCCYNAVSDVKVHAKDAQRRQTQMSENDGFVAFLTKN